MNLCGVRPFAYIHSGKFPNEKTGVKFLAEISILSTKDYILLELCRLLFVQCSNESADLNQICTFLSNLRTCFFILSIAQNVGGSSRKKKLFDQNRF